MVRHSTVAPSSDANPLHGDLRDCLNQAIANHQVDTISFAKDVSGTISLNNNLTTEPAGFANSDGKTAFIIGPDDNITINGPGITINGGGNTRLFMVQAGGTLNLTDLTLTGGMRQRRCRRRGAGSAAAAAAARVSAVQCSTTERLRLTAARFPTIRPPAGREAPPPSIMPAKAAAAASVDPAVTVTLVSI